MNKRTAAAGGFGFLKCLAWFAAGLAAFVVVVTIILAALTIRRADLPAVSGIVVDDLNAAAGNISSTVYNRLRRKDGKKKNWVKTGLDMLLSGKSKEEPLMIKLPRPQVVALTAFAENIYSANAEPDRQARFGWSGDALVVDYEFPVAGDLVIPFHVMVAPTIDNSKLSMRIDLFRTGSVVLPAKHCQKLADRALLELEKDPDYRAAIEVVSSLSWSDEGNTLTVVIPHDAALKLVKLIAGF